MQHRSADPHDGIWLGERRKECASKPAAKAVPLFRCRDVVVQRGVFLDIVGYSQTPVSQQMAMKQRLNTLIARAIERVSAPDRLILDTGEGASLLEGLLADLRLQYVQLVRATEEKLKTQAAQKFSGADMGVTILRETDLTGADLSGVDLSTTLLPRNYSPAKADSQSA